MAKQNFDDQEAHFSFWRAIRSLGLALDSMFANLIRKMVRGHLIDSSLDKRRMLS